MEHIVIGIEGLVGCGKTSICRELLNKIPNSVIFHGGNLYRGIIYALMQSNKKISNNMKNLKSNLQNVDIKKLMDELQVEIKVEDKETVIYVAGERIEEEKIQSQEASMAVSIAGGSVDHTNLFIFARNLINEFKEKYNVIVSGRALNTIYPNLNYHFLITASLDERVKRKAIQYGENVNLDELREHIKTRDDLQEKSGFYKISENTIKVDVTECKNVLESTEKVCKYIEELKAIV